MSFEDSWWPVSEAESFRCKKTGASTSGMQSESSKQQRILGADIPERKKGHGQLRKVADSSTSTS